MTKKRYINNLYIKLTQLHTNNTVIQDYLVALADFNGIEKVINSVLA